MMNMMLRFLKVSKMKIKMINKKKSKKILMTKQVSKNKNKRIAIVTKIYKKRK